MSEKTGYGSGLSRAPHGYYWVIGPSARRRLVRMLSSARASRIERQLIERAGAYRKRLAEGASAAELANCFTSRAQKIEALAKFGGAS